MKMVQNICKPILLVFTGLLFACSSDNDNALREQMIQQTVEDRIQRYTKEKKNSCREKALKEAGAIVDSILLSEARLKRDTAGRPAIPEKPERPEIVPVEDSLPVQPFFRDSSLELIEQDSLNIDNG